MPIIQNANGEQLKLMNNEWVAMDAQPPIAQNDAGEQRILIDGNWVEYSNGNAFDAKSNSWYPVGAGEYADQSANSLPSGEELINRMGGNDNPFTDMPDNTFTRLARDAAIIGLTGNIAGAVGAIPALANKLPAVSKAAQYVGKILNPTTASQAAQGGAVIGAIDSYDGDLPLAERAIETAKGAGISGVTGGAAQGIVNKVLGRKLSASDELLAKEQHLGDQLTKADKNILDADFLTQEGVELAPGQARDGFIGALEKYANEAPLLGGKAQAARQLADDSLNINRVNNSLSKIDQELVPNTRPGNVAIKQADDALSREYNRINAPLTVQMDNHLAVDLQNIIPNDVTRNATIQQLSQNNSYDFWSKTLNNMVNDKNHTLNKKSYVQLQAAIKRAADRQAPGTMDDVERAFASLNTVKDAANNVDAPNQVFNARQYLEAVQGNSTKRGFTRGEAFDQRFAQSADNVMTDTDVMASNLPGFPFLSNIGHESAALLSRPYYGDAVQRLVKANDAGMSASNIFAMAVNRIANPSIAEQKEVAKLRTDFRKQLATQ